MDYHLKEPWIEAKQTRAVHERFASEGTNLRCWRLPLGNKSFLRMQTCVKGGYFHVLVSVGPLMGPGVPAVLPSLLDQVLPYFPGLKFEKVSDGHYCARFDP